MHEELLRVIPSITNQYISKDRIHIFNHRWLGAIRERAFLRGWGSTWTVQYTMLTSFSTQYRCSFRTASRMSRGQRTTPYAPHATFGTDVCIVQGALVAKDVASNMRRMYPAEIARSICDTVRVLALFIDGGGAAAAELSMLAM